ncbi:thioesterase domain-containing protein [Streptomyces sp. TX20-6-3]|uniref:thioesterase II family protein n=1 Tax=Streptomyces sp. TX20-6-3 TaxID=3028705 RepID=UPI0029A7E6ED|nr:thioesterase domain-containing protein [Streptomyces sp. TX20-6-3]MDX2565284.1 thioesterase domain-containing protein [Streptomyces sp. TX20-6-3]
MTLIPSKVWLRQLTRPENPRWRVFCFPPAAAGSAFFRPWISSISDIELWAIQLPQREDRLTDKGPQTIGSTATCVAQALQWANQIPFAFFGHSLGALIAYETTIRLERQSMPTPTHLFVSSCAAPSAHKPRSFAADDDAVVMATLARLGMDPTLLTDQNMQELILEAARTDLAMFFGYDSNRAQVHCPISVLRGIDDATLTQSDLDPWCRHTPFVTSYSSFSGSHHYLHRNSQRVLDTITSTLFSDATKASGNHYSR